MPTDPATSTAAKTAPTGVLSRSLQGTSYLVLIQLITRLLTFTLNQVLLRFTDPRTLGIVSIRLELVLSTVLFLSREGIRCALLRTSDDVPTGTSRRFGQLVRRAALNLAGIPVLVGTGLTLVVCTYYAWTSVDSPATINAGVLPFLTLSVWLYGLSACLELLIEPLYVLTQIHLMYRFRVALEGVAVVVRCITTCALTLYGASLVADASTTSPAVNPYSVLAFAVAQLLYALTIAVGYLMFFYALSLPGRTQPITGTRQLWARRAVQLANISSEELDHLPALADLIPQPIDRTSNDFVGRYVPEPLRNLALVYTRQSLAKHLLTEGDKVAVTWLCSDTDQGVHAFVSNYGSLLARILFLPIEETSRTLFSRLLGSRTAELAASADPADVKARTADQAAALSYLTGVLRLYALLGLIFIAFGTNYTGLLIDVLVGSRWSLSAAPQTLAVYCLYIPILAVNGVTEAFVQSVATETQLARLSTVMGITSSIFVISVTLFVGWLEWGAVGVVLANIVSMGCRITYNFRFIRRFQPTGSPRFAWLPSKPTMTAGVIAWALTFASGRYVGWTTWSAKGLHIAVGGLGLVLVAVALLRFDQATVRAALGLLRKRKAD